ncbi:hypothetical protein BDA99DRAFT_514573 [Phascolomyces articulosus]|uniref:SWR1-complex protein 4 n=1 Tax=Phascolomyces articulosus TaxID=60185 RepID=A0AAD5PE99_9FUNG|nr:hypothetical protein BDA99DRAFT_514573 [Phascolomyces articulosus]
MSGSDIRDILQLGKPSTEASNLRRLNKPAERRPDGISRELYSLIGGAPPVALVRPTYKTKFNVKKKATPWVMERFINHARSDDLELSHWIKAIHASKPEYPFAYTRKSSAVLEYTKEEYQQCLAELDNEWTKEETDYLLDLCQKYDLRFIVIADRYEYSRKSRSIEDLKDRYYSVYRALLKYRETSSNETSIQQHYGFDKAKELERKEALEVLYSRTREQMEEEEALLVEVKRIEQEEARLTRERESVMHVQPIPLTTRANSSTSPHHYMNNNNNNNNSSGSSSHAPETKKRKRLASNAAATLDDKKSLMNNRQTTEDPSLSREKLIPGVHVQSQRLPVIKPSMQTKIIKVMDEVAVGPRPVMPTAAVCHGFEQLQSSISQMFELKKVVDKMEIEHKIKKKSRK